MKRLVPFTSLPGGLPYEADPERLRRGSGYPLPDPG